MLERQCKFFILVPVYKVEKYIDACICSVLNQEYNNFRLILVDDGSPDESGKICDEYAMKDNRICVIHKKNEGLISARRIAIKQALIEAEPDDFVIFLDSDDSLKRGALNTINVAINNHKCDLLIYGMDRVYEGNVIQSYTSKTSNVGIVENKRNLYKLVFTDATYNALWRKAVSVQLLSNEDYSNFYHISRGEDVLQSVPFYKNSKKVVFLEESLYNYTLNPNSITQTIDYENYTIDTTVRKYVYSFLEGEGVWNEKDFSDYIKFMRTYLKNEIRIIGRMNTSTVNKIDLLKKINEDSYYKKLIEGAKIFDGILYLLKEEKYRELCVVLELYGLMKRVIKK